MSLFGELQRRNVLRVATAYVAVSWLIVQVAETLFPLFGLGDTAIRAEVVVLAAGFVPALIVAWAFQWTPEGSGETKKSTAHRRSVGAMRCT